MKTASEVVLRQTRLHLVHQLEAGQGPLGTVSTCFCKGRIGESRRTLRKELVNISSFRGMPASQK